MLLQQHSNGCWFTSSAANALVGQKIDYELRLSRFFYRSGEVFSFTEKSSFDCLALFRTDLVLGYFTIITTHSFRLGAFASGSPHVEHFSLLFD